MKSCQTCKNERCSDEVYFNCAAKDYQKWEGREEMSNEMPELKPGIIIEYDGIEKAKRGMLFSSDKGLFCVLGDNKWISEEQFLNFNIEKINSIYKIKQSQPFLTILCSQNLELIWQRKPATDWTKVAVDEKVLVRDVESDPWEKRHFAKVDKNNRVITFANGRTSFSDDGVKSGWNYAILYEGNEHLVGDKHE